MTAASSVIEEMAFSLGRDPLDVRRANFYPAEGGGVTPYHMEVTDCVIAEMVDELERTSDYRARRKATRRSSGIASTVQTKKRGWAGTIFSSPVMSATAAGPCCATIRS